MNDKQRQALINEALDTRKMLLFCEVHGYIGGPSRSPYPGCKSCWMAYFVGIMAKTPPHKREQKLQELETIVHKLAEDVERGKADFTLFEHPHINIERDVADSDIQKEKSKDISEE